MNLKAEQIYEIYIDYAFTTGEYNVQAMFDEDGNMARMLIMPVTATESIAAAPPKKEET